MKNNPVAKYMNQLNKPNVVPHKHAEKLEKQLDIEAESAKLDLLRYGYVNTFTEQGVDEDDISMCDIGCSNLNIDD